MDSEQDEGDHSIDQGLEGRRIFVTVGSTKFTSLVAAMLSCKVIDAIVDACSSSSKIPTLTIQYGATSLSDILLEDGSAIQRMSNNEKKDDEHDPLGASGTLPIPMSAFLSQSEQGEKDALKKEFVAKSFRLNQHDKFDKPNEDDEDDKLRLKQKSFKFSVQAGSSKKTIQIELLDFVKDIKPFLISSEIVISHAGSGTILEALRLPVETKPKLIIIPNETLMDNHQTELANALAQQNYVIATRVKGLKGEENRLPELFKVLLSPQDDSTKIPRLAAFPDFVPGRFRSFIDAEMGYI